MSAVFDNDGTGQRGNLGGRRARDPARRGGARRLRPRPRRRQAQGAVAAPHAALARLRRQGRERPVLSTSTAPTDFGQGPLQAPSVFNFFSPVLFAARRDLGPAGWSRRSCRSRPSTRTRWSRTISTRRSSTATRDRTSRIADVVVIDIETGDRRSPADPAGARRRRAREAARGPDLGHAARAGGGAGRAASRAGDAAQRVAEAVWLIATSPEFAQQR